MPAISSSNKHAVFGAGIFGSAVFANVPISKYGQWNEQCKVGTTWGSAADTDAVWATKDNQKTSWDEANIGPRSIKYCKD